MLCHNVQISKLYSLSVHKGLAAYRDVNAGLLFNENIGLDVKVNNLETMLEQMNERVSLLEHGNAKLVQLNKKLGKESKVRAKQNRILAKQNRILAKQNKQLAELKDELVEREECRKFIFLIKDLATYKTIAWKILH